MACYHPLRAFPVGKLPSGKTNYKIMPLDCKAFDKHLWSGIFCEDEKWNRVKDHQASYIVTESVVVPCGQCKGCRLEYSRQWANRLMMELPYHEFAWFFTLTYDDRHVPYTDNVDPYSGLEFKTLTLNPRHLELFWKRLRRKFPDTKIMYYAAGEYGSETLRPHYHAIVFGPDIPDLKFYANVRGNIYMTSELINSLWRDDGDPFPRGFVVIGEVTWKSCAYVARYCMKKAKDKYKKAYQDFGMVPEFARMSKKPAIGRQFYFDHPDLMFYNKINLSTPDGGIKFKPPRYFDKLFELDYPSQFEMMKAVRREKADGILKQILSKTDKDLEDYLEVQECLADNRIKKLLRGDCNGPQR